MTAHPIAAAREGHSKTNGAAALSLQRASARTRRLFWNGPHVHLIRWESSSNGVGGHLCTKFSSTQGPFQNKRRFWDSSDEAHLYSQIISTNCFSDSKMATKCQQTLVVLTLASKVAKNLHFRPLLRPQNGAKCQQTLMVLTLASKVAKKLSKFEGNWSFLGCLLWKPRLLTLLALLAAKLRKIAENFFSLWLLYSNSNPRFRFKLRFRLVRLG